MSHPIEIIGDKLFSGKAWTLTRHVRANGTKFFQLTEMAGYRADWPVIYADGHVAFDRPEALPKAVKEWTTRLLYRFR